MVMIKMALRWEEVVTLLVLDLDAGVEKAVISFNSLFFSKLLTTNGFFHLRLYPKVP